MQPRRPTHLASLTVLAALTTVLLGACGAGSPSSPAGAASTESASYRAELAYAQCMRAHGLSRFPNPTPSKGFSFGGQLNGNPKSPAARANDACEHLLSLRRAGLGGATASPTTSPPGAVAADCLTSQPPCYTPRQLRVAYDIQPLLDRGITGRGQTVVLLEFPPSAAGSSSAVTGVQVPASSDIRQDLARFDGVFGLPAARLQIVNSRAHAASPWLASIEEVEDTEIVHAVAPDASIREVLIPSSYVASPGRVVAAVLLGLCYVLLFGLTGVAERDLVDVDGLAAGLAVSGPAFEDRL